MKKQSEDSSGDGALCSPGEAAKILGVSPKTVQLWMDSGILFGWKTVGGHRRVTVESVERLKREGAMNGVATLSSEKKGGADDVYLGRQPILDRQQRIVAYELLYRGGASDLADIKNQMEASARVIAYAFSELGIGAALGRGDCYINIDKEMLMSGITDLLPRGNVTLELVGDIDLTDAFIERCQQLRSDGVRLALGDYVLGSKARQLLPYVDTVEVSVLGCDDECLEQTVREIRSASNVRLLAKKVETAEQFRRCLDMGFDFFLGYYFARPHLVVGKRIHPSKVILIQLLKLVMGDAPSNEIENLLKGEPNLCYSLFRLVNSVAMGINRRISSVKEVVTFIGRRHLQRWVSLLMFAQLEGFSYPNPLLQTAALRGELMRKLAMIVAAGNPGFQEQAFMVGIMSLLDALLGVPMEEILGDIHVVDEVHEALISHKGRLGALLAICEMLEGEKFEALPAALNKLKLDVHSVMQAQMEALQWVNAIGESVYA